MWDGSTLTAVLSGLDGPQGLVADASGNLWFIDGPSGNRSIFKWDRESTPTQELTGVNGPPLDLAFDRAGDLCISASTTVMVWDGSRKTTLLTSDSKLMLNIEMDASDRLWMCHSFGISTWNGYAEKQIVTGNAASLAFDASGNLWSVNEQDGTVSMWDGSTWHTIVQGLKSPLDLAFDASGNLWIVHYGNGNSNGQVSKWDVSTSTLTTPITSGLVDPNTLVFV